jgi:uncharacterized protein with PQ loop repeat
MLIKRGADLAMLLTIVVVGIVGLVIGPALRVAIFPIPVNRALRAVYQPQNSRRQRHKEAIQSSIGRMTRAVVMLSAIMLCGCEELVVRDTSSLLLPQFQRSEVVGVVAGFGTTFAAVPDLIRMFKRRSSKGMNPMMVGIMGFFQILWVYYGFLIQSRPVIAWNMVAVVINSMTVWAYFRFARRERNQARE